MRAALSGRHGVDFVDDYRVNVGERAARRRSEHEVEALRRSDEDVGGIAQHALTITGTRVARAHCDERFAKTCAEAFGRMADANDWRTQVFLDVECESSKRRHVENACRGNMLWVERDESIDGHEERSQGLAASGGCRDQRVIAGDDFGEAPGLRVSGGWKRRREPGANW